MTFKRGILKLSELIADTITGATFRTADPAAGANRLEIAQDLAGGLLQFFGTNPTDTPGSINPTGAPSSPISLTLLSGKRAGGQQAALFLIPSTVPGLALAQVNAGTIVLGNLSTGPGGGPTEVVWPTGTTTHGIDCGDVSSATLVSGRITIAHNLGVKPVAAFWSDGAGNHPARGTVDRGSFTTSTFDVLFRLTTTDALATGGVTGGWLAIA